VDAGLNVKENAREIEREKRYLERNYKKE